MLRTDEDALLCDFAETYHIYDLGSLPVKTVAALAFGLRDDSRIKMIMAGLKVPVNQMLLAHIADSANYIKWTKTEAAVNNPSDPPDRLLNVIMGMPQAGDSRTCKGFKTIADFEAARAKIIRGKKHGD
jgi:hypothetical protein